MIMPAWNPNAFALSKVGGSRYTGEPPTCSCLLYLNGCVSRATEIVAALIDPRCCLNAALNRGEEIRALLLVSRMLLGTRGTGRRSSQKLSCLDFHLGIS